MRLIQTIAAVTFLLILPQGLAAEEPPVDGDGMYTQDWFYTSFMDMGEDLGDAAAEGKHLMVLFEQRGCPYCRELHSTNLSHPEISAFLQDNYIVVQVNIWGDREMTDFDGEVTTEKDLAGKWGVHFTPTTVLIHSSADGAEAISDAEAFRMPGYFKPFHFMTALEFAADGSYADQNFQRYLQARFERLEAEGKDPSVW